METSLNKSKSAVLILLFSVISVVSFAQKPRFKEKKIAKNVKNHIEYLASDELEGRGTGSAGEQLSAKYIADQFEKIGLQPKGTRVFSVYEYTKFTYGPSQYQFNDWKECTNSF